MKKTVSLITLLCVLLSICFLIVACSNTQDGSSLPTSPDRINGPIDNLGGGGTAEDATNIENSCAESEISVAGKINLSDLKTDVDTIGAVTLTNNSITDSGKYLITGTWNEGIQIANGLTVHLFLDNATITNNNGVALSSDKKCTITITLQGENTITNNCEDKNAIHLKGNVKINGTGILNVSSQTKNAINVSKQLLIVDSTINASGANHGITAESIAIQDATINITSAGKDGLQVECDYDEPDSIDDCVFTTESGFVSMQNVNYTSNTYGDGIQADTFVYINGGVYNINSTGTFVNKTFANMEEYDLEADDFKYILKGTSYERVASDYMGSSNLYALTQSCKGIKVGEIEFDADGDGVDETVLIENTNYSIMIDSGTFNIETTDDAIHANSGDIIINGGDYTINTFDDGMGADDLLKVTNGIIDIASSYEGLEGSFVEIFGGTINIVSSDDGINAASDYDSVIEHIIISGGSIVVNADGDGIDSNGSAVISGGTIIVYGPTNGGNGGLDSDLGVLVKGGTLFVSSSLGMVETPAKNSSQNIVSYGSQTTLASGTTISIKDENESIIFSTTLAKNAQSIIVSSPNLCTNKTYKFYIGSTEVQDFTINDIITTIGISGGQMGGPGGGNPPFSKP